MWIYVLENSEEEVENKTASLLSFSDGIENDGKFKWHIGGHN